MATIYSPLDMELIGQQTCYCTQPQGQVACKSSNSSPEMSRGAGGIVSGKKEYVDGWIDNLIPGLETQLPNSMAGRDTIQDRLIDYLVRNESERDPPAMQLPVFSCAAKA